MSPARDGDALVLELRFEEAIDAYAGSGDTESLGRVLDLAVDFGRYRAVKRLQAILPAERRLSPERYRAFLVDRALPQVPIGGHLDRGFFIHRDVLDDIVAEVGEPLGPLIARTARRMLEGSSRHLAKLFVFARLADDRELLRCVEDRIEERRRHPRACLRSLLDGPGVRIIRTIQEGDGDDFNPKSASLFQAEIGEAEVVLKESLRLPVDFSRTDGYSDERGIIASLAHPDVVRLTASIALGGHEVMALGLAPGEPLEPRALCDPGEALVIGARLAGVLAYLHTQRIVYMDLKAKNVLHDRETGRLTLVDFGMARRLGPGQTSVRSLLSTPAYVPPEMARGFVASPASDVFQLGILLCALLKGRHPFARVPVVEGEEMARADQLVTFALANLRDEPDLDGPELRRPRGLRDLLRRMLAKDPAERPVAAEVQTALGES